MCKKFWFFFVFSSLLFFCSCEESPQDALNDSNLTEEELLSDKLIQSKKTDAFFLNSLYTTKNSCVEVKVRFQEYYLERLEKDYLWHKKWINRGVLEDSIEVSANSAEFMNEKVGPKNYSKTNTQVAEVDEADIVKTDGTYAYQVEGKNFYITKIWPADELELVGNLELGSSGINLFLDEEAKKVFVFSHHSINELSSTDSLPEWGWQQSYTKLTSIDIADRANPSILKVQVFPGSYKDSRRKKGKIYFFLHEHDSMPEGVGLESSYAKSLSEQHKILEASYLKSKELILKQDLSDWLERSYEDRENSDSEKLYSDLDCTRIYFPEVPESFGKTRLVSFDTEALTFQEDLVMSSASYIYASLESVYLMANHYRSYAEDNSSLSLSYIHRFETSGDSVLYKGSGIVDGFLLNQFSVDEHKDHFRIATTLRVEVEGESEEGSNFDDSISDVAISPAVGLVRTTTFNRVTSLSLENDYLKIVGESKDLAEGERIYSVRFMGDRGYVVTFKQVDPLFTLDLSDPKNPEVLGELKVPGFSSYIHPISENHLLTIGRQVDEETGRQQGLKLSLFDVSDMTNPLELSTYIETENTWSEAEWDHHAFNYYAPVRTLALPVEVYNDALKQYLFLYEITEGYKIEKKESLNLSGFIDDHFLVKRSLFVSSEEDKVYVYPILSAGLSVYDFEDLTESLGKVVFSSYN